MGADNSFYVKFIATYAPTFFGYIISVLAIVRLFLMLHLKRYTTSPVFEMYQQSWVFWPLFFAYTLVFSSSPMYLYFVQIAFGHAVRPNKSCEDKYMYDRGQYFFPDKITKKC